jgi:hypothetical protein
MARRRDQVCLAADTDRLDKPDRRAIQPGVDLAVLEPVSDARQTTDKAGNPGLAFPASSHQFRPNLAQQRGW